MSAEGIHVVCAYFGVPGECQECGFDDPTGTGFCSHDCAQARADRVNRHKVNAQARRAADDAFAREVERLRAQGLSDVEIDEALKGMP